LRDVRLQRGEARFPALVAVGLDLRQIGERRSDMTDRVISKKPLVGSSRNCSWLSRAPLFES
jgi:hypothetical protein